MTKKIFFAGIVFFAMLLSACASKATVVVTTFGKPIDKEKVDLIVKNETTEEEILEMFGKPMNKALVDDQEQWMYVYQETNSISGGSSVHGAMLYQKLDILIKDGIVVNYVFN